jgi:hypothetical protein
LAGCVHLTGQGDLLDRYARAQCIPVKSLTTTGPATRVWNYDFRDGDGRTVRVSGTQMPGGRVDVRFSVDGSEVIAADAGDYIYPADVRLSAESDRLYVKAEGMPATSSTAETWLFDYDLRRRKLASRARVDPRSLPRACEPNQ